MMRIINDIIGVDSFVLYLPSYYIKEDHQKISIEYSKNERCNTIVLERHDGTTTQCSNVKFIDPPENLFIYFDSLGYLKVSGSIPQILNKHNITLFGPEGNYRAIKYIFNVLSEGGIGFDPKDFRIIRLDIAQNIKLTSEPILYHNFFSKLPHTSKSILHEDSLYFTNGSFCFVAYNKLKKSLTSKNTAYLKEKLLSELDKQNFMRIEIRWKKARKLKRDGKKIGIDLQNPATLFDKEKYKCLQNLYLSYVNKSLKTPPLPNKMEEKEHILKRLRLLRMAGCGTNDAMVLTHPIIGICDINEVAYTLHPESRQNRLAFKKRFKLKQQAQEILDEYSKEQKELYMEIRQKALSLEKNFNIS